MMAIVLVLGMSWGKLFKRGYTQDEYGVELAKRDSTIEQLQDSIRVMRTKLEVYEQAVKWFRNADEGELQRGIEQIRSVYWGRYRYKSFIENVINYICR